MIKRAWIFGYSKPSKMIAKALRDNGFLLNIIESNDKYYHDALSDGHEESFCIDITEDEELEKLDIQPNDTIVCVMEDEHLNVFLTLSLRSFCTSNQIIAVSHSIYATQKLKMAGANKVIDIYQVSANRIHNIFKKPVATKLLDNFISSSHEISFREIQISKDSLLDGIGIDEFDFGKYGLIMAGMMDLEPGEEFIFATANINHKLDCGDIIVCLGKDSDLDNFEKILEGSNI